ncbi:MAG: hypothetical protein V7739_05930 [Motiliproteus sp.]
MQTNEVVHARIDALTAGLSNAVRATGGAEFALMLSMISESQVLAKQMTEGVGVDTPPAQISNRDQLYTGDVVERLNRSLKGGQLGELQLLLSWLETVPLQGRTLPLVVSEAPTGIPVAQAALLARQYSMLDEVSDSRLRLAA